MDFNIDVRELQEVMKLFAGLVKPNTGTVTSLIKVEAVPGEGVLFTGTDGVSTLTYTSEESTVNSTEAFSGALIFHKLHSFINSFKPWNEAFGAKDFHFIGEGRYITIKTQSVNTAGGVSNGKIKLKNEAYNLREKVYRFSETLFIINSSIIQDAISKVIYAADKENKGNVALTGMNINFKDNIYFAAGDGKILSEYEINNTTDMEQGSYLLPSRFVLDLRRIISGNIQIHCDIQGNKFIMKFNNIEISCSLIVGDSFPDYRGMLETYTKTTVLDKESLLTGLRSFFDIVSEEDHNRISVDLNSGKIFMSTPEASLTIEDKNIEGTVEFAFDVDCKKMAASIDPIKDDQIAFKFTDSKTALIFDSYKFKNQKAIVMPIMGH